MRKRKRGAQACGGVNRPKEARMKCTLVQASSVDFTTHSRHLGSRCPEERTTPQFLGLKGGGLIGERKKAENTKEATLDGESP